MRIALIVLLALLAAPGHARGVYQEPEAFVAEAFAGKAPSPHVLWMSKAMHADAEEILGHPYGAMRVRYWGEPGRTVWVLEEIGKEEPITVGIIVNGGRLEVVKVLVFRESRGDEVRHPFFTEQFKGAGLRERELDRHIDGISGATLSVRALQRLARLALYLHGHSEFAR